jgi:antitoxin (DNA-binding transcriptional repressor) of toxin-antitoxin stability system
MKHVTASEARKNWFKLLDEAANGEIIAIQRDDKKLILRAEKRRKRPPSYKGLIDFKDADDADTWGWEWKRPGGLVEKNFRKRKP